MSGIDMAIEYLSQNVQGEFEPFAYYDDQLDCIRVRIQDCSMIEQRLNRFLTLVVSAHEGHPIGFNIKGVRHLFQEIGLDVGKVHKIADVLDAIVKRYPDGSSQKVRSSFSGAMELKVDMPAAA